MLPHPHPRPHKWHYQGSGRFTKQAGSPPKTPARFPTIRFLRGHGGSPTIGHDHRGVHRAKYRRYKLGRQRGSNRGASSQDSEGDTSTHRQNHRKTPSHGTKRERHARNPPRGPARVATNISHDHGEHVSHETNGEGTEHRNRGGNSEQKHKRIRNIPTFIRSGILFLLIACFPNRPQPPYAPGIPGTRFTHAFEPTGFDPGLNSDNRECRHSFSYHSTAGSQNPTAKGNLRADLNRGEMSTPQWLRLRKCFWKCPTLGVGRSGRRPQRIQHWPRHPRANDERHRTPARGKPDRRHHPEEGIPQGLELEALDPDGLGRRDHRVEHPTSQTSRRLFGRRAFPSPEGT